MTIEKDPIDLANFSREMLVDADPPNNSLSSSFIDESSQLYNINNLDIVLAKR